MVIRVSRRLHFQCLTLERPVIRNMTYVDNRHRFTYDLRVVPLSVLRCSVSHAANQSHPCRYNEFPPFLPVAHLSSVLWESFSATRTTGPRYFPRLFISSANHTFSHVRYFRNRPNANRNTDNDIITKSDFLLCNLRTYWKFKSFVKQ